MDPNAMMSGKMPDPTLNLPPIPGMQGGPSDMQGPGMNIAKKMGKQPKAPHIQSVDLLTTAIKTLNQYAELTADTDQANSRAARMVISVLGEMLKTAHQDQMAQQPPPVL